MPAQPERAPTSAEDLRRDLLARWEAVDRDDTTDWQQAHREVTAAFVLERLGLSPGDLDAVTRPYLDWLGGWDVDTVVHTATYLEWLASAAGPPRADAASFLEWLARWDAPTIAGTVRLAQLAHDRTERSRPDR